ncbi:MAG: hypothetical protein HFH35_04500 [Eubacterium sp.]|nr:hypothetical protein [Eubacterium sp.]
MQTVLFVLAAVFLLVGAALLIGSGGRVQEKKRADIQPKNRQRENELQKTAVKKEQGTQERIEKLLSTERSLWELEQERPYERLFEQSALPLQMLLGLAAVSEGMLDQEKIDYYLKDVIAEPLISAVKNAGGKTRHGIIILPENAKTFAAELKKEAIEKLSMQEIEAYTRENELRMQAGRIALQKAAAARELGGVVNAMELFVQAAHNGRDRARMVGAQADSVAHILEKHGIYPMFAGDQRLGADVRKRFGTAGEHSLRYPGLLIQRDGAWEVLGANIGMDREV